MSRLPNGRVPCCIALGLQSVPQSGPNVPAPANSQDAAPVGNAIGCHSARLPRRRALDSRTPLSRSTRTAEQSGVGITDLRFSEGRLLKLDRTATTPRYGKDETPGLEGSPGARVEPAGVEPASANRSLSASTCVVCLSVFLVRSVGAADRLSRTSSASSHHRQAKRQSVASPIQRRLRAHLGPGRSGDGCVNFRYAANARLELAFVLCFPGGLTR